MKLAGSLGVIRDHRHLPHGRCGLKLRLKVVILESFSHLPHGRCGLKCVGANGETYESASPPAREVWIEIHTDSAGGGNTGSPPAREVWIEINVIMF